jgi:hypothetical protein
MIATKFEIKQPDQIGMGYILLPNDTSHIAFSSAAWTSEALRTADELAWQIIRDIRSGKFWPPSEPPEFSEEFAAICQDHVFEPWQEE